MPTILTIKPRGSSGEKAIEYLHVDKADLPLLDMIMDPGMNGHQTFEEIVNTC